MLAGAYASLGNINMSGIRLPAFDKIQLIDHHDFKVFDAVCNYDVVWGDDFLAKVGINLKYDDLTMEWLGKMILMETMKRSTSKLAQIASYISNIYKQDLVFDLDSYLAAPILEVKYEKVKIDDVIKKNCQHLTKKQQRLC